MDSSETGSLTIIASKQYIGFTQSGETPQPDLTFNGLYENLESSRGVPEKEFDLVKCIIKTNFFAYNLAELTHIPRPILANLNFT